MKDLKEFSESVQALASSAVLLQSHGYDNTSAEIVEFIRLMVSQYKGTTETAILSLQSELSKVL